MLHLIVVKMLKFIAKRLDGYKTIIGGVGFILTGILGIIRIMFPDLTYLPDMDIESALASISAGITAIGLGGKIQKAGQK